MEQEQELTGPERIGRLAMTTLERLDEKAEEHGEEVEIDHLALVVQYHTSVGEQTYTMVRYDEGDFLATKLLNSGLNLMLR
jgi:hypothetical protein